MDDDILELKPFETPVPRPAPGLPTRGQAPLSAADELPDAAPTAWPERDCIVVLGRRQSGKTIFLASIYARLWKSLDGLTAKSLTGDVHRQLMSVHQMLREGEWPPSTLGTTQLTLEIEYHGKRRLLVALDFAGELFSKAFVEEQVDWPGVKELVKHIDRAAAVLMLVDPSVVAGGDKHAAMEDDFGLVQAAERIRNWPGGKDVPIILVLTKVDQYQQLLDQHGGTLEFVRRQFPALLRLLKEVPIIQVSAVQVEMDAQGKARPRRDSTPINIDCPVRYCLREIEKAERVTEMEQAEDQRRMLESRLLQEERQRQQRVQSKARRLVAAVLSMGMLVAAAVLYFHI